MDGYAFMLWLMVRVEGEGEVSSGTVVVNANVDCAMGCSARLTQSFLNCNTMGEVSVTLLSTMAFICVSPFYYYYLLVRYAKLPVLYCWPLSPSSPPSLLS